MQWEAILQLFSLCANAILSVAIPVSRIAVGACGAFFVFVILIDAFETIVLPRRVTRNFRLTRLFYRRTWVPVRAIGRCIQNKKRRETFLSYFGPVSLIMLLVLWAMGLILGFAMLQYGAGSHLSFGPGNTEPLTFHALIYMSGSTFFTLGIGNAATPEPGIARILAIFEAGIGFGFLAIVIGYLPVIFGNFSQREINITLLDSRAGSPPTAAELLSRFGPCKNNQPVIDSFFQTWERWSAELLESHLSYPVLSYFRSQHDNQSWLAALTSILDSSALLIAGVQDFRSYQAKLTFAMARHAIADLAQIFKAPPRAPAQDRLPDAEFERMAALLATRGIVLNRDETARARLTELRAMYEPYISVLSEVFLMPLPPWAHSGQVLDNWKTSAWGRISKNQERELQPEHF
jgi:hypothetical protein